MKINKDTSQGPNGSGYLAKRPIVGLILFTVGSLVFGVLAYSVTTNGPLLQWDLPVANSLHVLALESPAFVIDIMIVVYYLALYAMAAIAVLFGIYFLYRRSLRELTMLVVGTLGAVALFNLIVYPVGRLRPVFETQIWNVITIPGFPSGHVIYAVTFYGLIAYLFVPRIRSRFWRILIVTITVLFLGLVGYSRLFLGDHYLTDVIAGYAVGIAWSGLSYTLIEMIFKRYHDRRPASPSLI